MAALLTFSHWAGRSALRGLQGPARDEGRTAVNTTAVGGYEATPPKARAREAKYVYGRKQPIYAIMLAMTILLASATVLTLVPVFEMARVTAIVLPLPVHKANLLGYVSYCPFAPVSTLLTALLTGTVCTLRSRFAKGVVVRR